jgi:hypothetical protein
VRIGFDTDSADWKGVDRLDHRANGGAKDGYVTATRAKNLNPIATTAADPKRSPIAGDWPAVIGGDSATVSWRFRSAETGTIHVELFAAETQWSYRVPQPAAGDWQAHTVTLRYDWTDAQATAAGWSRAQSAFSWRDTIRHVGRLSFAFNPSQGEATQSFDLDEVMVHGK